MLQHLLRRLIWSIPLLLLVTFGTFVLLFQVGDPARVASGEFATADQIEATRQRLGLDRNIVVQYLDWLGGVLRGDFGLSYSGARPVSELVVQRVPATASLMVFALLVAFAMAVPMGLAVARWPSGWRDGAFRGLSSIGLAIPNFFLGLILVLVFAVKLNWLPAGGYRPISDGIISWLERLVLPAATLGLALGSEQARTFRSSMRRELQADYVRTARAKHVPGRIIATRHAARNAALPLITVIALQIGRVVAGTVFIETVFSIPGLGSLAAQAVTSRDLPVVQAVVVLTTVVVLLTSLLVDVAYGLFNPVVRGAW